MILELKDHTWVFPKIGVKPSKGDVFQIMENPYCLMDDLGGKPTILGHPHIFKIGKFFLRSPALAATASSFTVAGPRVFFYYEANSPHESGVSQKCLRKHTSNDVGPGIFSVKNAIIHAYHIYF